MLFAKLIRLIMTFRRNFVVVIIFINIVIFVNIPRNNYLIDPEKDTKTSFVCGRPGPVSLGILSRIESRITCRLSDTAPESLSSQLLSAPKKPLLTHDFVNAVGLGNFMFICASTIGLAKLSGRTAIFSHQHLHMAHFEHPFPVLKNLSEAERNKIVEETAARNTIDVVAAGKFFPSVAKKLSVNLTTPENKNQEGAGFVTLHGYLQSWKYFNASQNVIRKQFVFQKSVFNTALQKLKDTIGEYSLSSAKKPTTIIGLHVRRGDILKPHFKLYGHTSATKSYLLKRTQLLSQHYDPAVFIVVSNDAPYCKELFAGSKNFIFMDQNAPAVDMAILSLMDHLILTVGTFGWWGAYLSEARQIYYYKDWPKKGSKMDKEFNQKDFFPSHWIPAS